MKWFWSCYLASPADAANPLAAPLCATNLAGLPPASILTAEFDPPRDEGEAYADRLRAAGVPVVARRYLGMIHGFASLPFITEVANRAVADVARDLRAALTA
jgi:acetyl esterase